MTRRITTSQMLLIALVLLASLAVSLIVGGSDLGIAQDSPKPTLWEYHEVHTSTVPAATLVTETPSLLDTLPTPPERVEKPTSIPSLTSTTEEKKNDN